MSLWMFRIGLPPNVVARGNCSQWWTIFNVQQDDGGWLVLNFCRHVKAEMIECSSKVKKRPLYFLSFPLLQCCKLGSPLFYFPLLPLYCTVNLFIKKKNTSFISWPWTKLTGQLRFLFRHSVALKDSLVEELLTDYRLIVALRFWLEPALLFIISGGFWSVRVQSGWSLMSHETLREIWASLHQLQRCSLTKRFLNKFWCG